MKYLVTGAAGFIGSQITKSLLDLGDEVIGLDCFLNSYPRSLKEARIRPLMDCRNLEFIEDNILSMDLRTLVDRVDTIIHTAAQPCPRSSWGTNFESYSRNNIEATQKLLEAAKDLEIKKLVYSSSSSVYGNAEELPTKEDFPTKPVSPYGVTKLAGEHLCHLYCENYGVPVVILRYFTVLGPKPRPDMAHTIFSKAILSGEQIRMFGDGEQSRGFTYVSDVVDATVSAAGSQIVDEVFNIGGGATATMNEVVRMLEEIAGKKAIVCYIETQKGDVTHTRPDISKAERLLDYHPRVGLREGLAEVVRSVKEFYKL
jgi:UDP-glucose 4-epimerase